MKPESNLFDNQKCIKIEFPFTVTSSVVEKLIKQEQSNNNWKVRELRKQKKYKLFLLLKRES